MAPPTLEERVKNLKLKREAFKVEIEQFVSLLDAYEPGTSVSEVRIRFEEMESEYAVFCKTQGELDSADESGHLMMERITLKVRCATCKARAIDIINHGNTASRPGNASVREPLSIRESPVSHVETVDGDVRLPKLNLPVFSGEYEDWPGFSDQFKSSVHDKVGIDDCKKLMYLRSCLKDEAAKDIKSLGNSARNYIVAWDILEKRYNQPAIIVANHLQALFEAPLLQKSSHRDFRAFISMTESHYRSLQVLKQPTADTTLIHLLLSKLDKEMVVKWKEHKREDLFPSMDTFFEFLHDRCNVSEPLIKGELTGVASTSQAVNNRVRQGPEGRNKYAGRELRSSTRVLLSQATKCSFCSGSHLSHNCEMFVNLSVAERFNLAKEKRLCFNCLRSSHSVRDCQSSTCRQCHKKHHTLLHFGSSQTPPPVQVNNTCSVGTNPSQIMFGTAVIDIMDKFGKAIPCRVLLDSCAASHFLSARMCKFLKLDTQPSSIQLRGTNAMSSAVSRVACADIKSRHSNFALNVTFLVVKEVSQPLPQEMVDETVFHIPAGIHLADPNFNIPGEVDAIIGIQCFWDLLCVGRKSLANQSMKLQKTQLGWIVVGQLPLSQPTEASSCHLTLDTLQADVHRFWAIEECPSEKLCSPEEQACEDHYEENTTRDPISGRYTVSLPFNDKRDKLGNSHSLAMKRFFSLERSLDKNLSTKTQYIDFLREYEQLGHMTEIIEETTSGCYLPHHPVVKIDSITTKVRVVFDASARSSSGLSLNDTLMVGPTIQDDLISLIMRFRFHRYALTADIAKMYRQVNLLENDRQYHKILWRESSDVPIRTYQLNTVTYGTASAPYLAIRTLHRLAQDEILNYSRAADILLKDFYVDDVLTGASSIQDAIAIRDELIALTAKGGFQLRQWVSNDPRLIEPLGSTNPTEHMVLNELDGKKTLGLYWRARQDTLGYTVTPVEPLFRVTKRAILSRVAQLFDPLGLLGPVIVQGKLIIQALWKSRLDWDDLVPLEIHTAWVTFQSQLHLITKVTVPRWVLSESHKELQLHGFCDASERAYGACIYVRTFANGHHHTVRLLCSKSKVAPLKTQSLPRLELCAAVLLIRLYNLVKKAIRSISFDKVMFWSDSTITLHWIRAPPHTLKQFVANRVTEIQRHSTSIQWSHVPSEHNAADLLSRGTNVVRFLESPTWFNGPRWLAEPEHEWPRHELQTIEVPEQRKVIVVQATSQSECQLLTRFSSFSALNRVVAYCLRFFGNTHRRLKVKGPLSVDELQQAHCRVMRLWQDLVFSKEVRELIGGSCERGNRLSGLCPFVDKDGLLRVGGRLQQSQLPFYKKHPLIIPQQHHCTELIIREAHIRHGHSGAQGTLNAVRQMYWPVNGLVAVKSVLRKCVTCSKLQLMTPRYPMGQLPKDRVTCNRPFLITGVDYCGPFFIKEKKHRNTKRIKVYVAVFVCFSTRALHIELVSDLTTDAFLAALKRFIARRGKCTDIYSDNGTNFVGADRELKRIHQDISAESPNNKVYNYLLDQRIRWHFIPPRAPHFGGVWEAAVKSLKRHLVRIFGNTLLTYEEFTTCLIEVEAMLNSRPLTPLSSDPNDLVPLTPGHFIIGDSLTGTPECDLTCVKTGRLSSWQHLQQLRQHFWARWYKEYLNELTVRKKWHDNQVTRIAVGMLVVLKEDNTPPLCWPMGRITAVHPGEDGVIRVATVKTAGGEYKRSVKKLAPLFAEEM